jgi:hypothetical protein
MSRTTTAQPKPLIVRAWFDTVLNPIIRGLETEAAVLEKGDLTWRFEQRRLASLVPVRHQLVPGAWPNYDQFIGRYPECQPLINEHDRLVAELLESCRALEKRLVESNAMQELFKRTTVGLSDVDLGNCFGATQSDDYLKVLAEYIINRVERLPHYYTTAIFWNQHGQEFLGLRESEEIRPVWEATLDARTRFSRAIAQVSTSLRTLREDLSYSAGVPIVDGSSLNY